MRPPSENNLSAAALECRSVFICIRGDAHVDSDTKMKVLRFAPDLYSMQIITHHFELRQHGWMHRLETLSLLHYYI